MDRDEGLTAMLPGVIPLGGFQLQRWHPSHVNGLAAAFARTEPDLRQWMPSAAREQEHAESFIDACVDLFEAGRNFAYAIVVDADVVGYCNLIPEAAVATIAYWVRPDHRGRGIATETARTFADVGLSSLRVIERVRAYVDAGNVASRRVLENAGYRLMSSTKRPARTASETDTELLFAKNREDRRPRLG
jgi:RimJ/RimL family protein N-acetyltransferase